MDERAEMDYEPYGKQWAKEVKRLTKDEIIRILGEGLKEKDEQLMSLKDERRIFLGTLKVADEEIGKLRGRIKELEKADGKEI